MFRAQLRIKSKLQLDHSSSRTPGTELMKIYLVVSLSFLHYKLTIDMNFASKQIYV